MTKMINLLFKKYFSLFLKYCFWALKIGLNILLFILVDIPMAILTVPRWTHYLIFFYVLYYSILAQVGYWMARYLVAEEWVYDGYNSPEFENHYYQWRFLLMIRRYTLFALSIIFKILLGWLLAIVHFLLWNFYQFFRNIRRNFKKLSYNFEFIYWKIIYAFGVRVNLSINNSFRFFSFSKDFFCFDRKGWYYYGRDYVDVEALQMVDNYIPQKFRIKKIGEQISTEILSSFRKFLSNMRKNQIIHFSKEDVRFFLKKFDKKMVEGTFFESYDFYTKLEEFVEVDYWKKQEQLLKKDRLYDKDGNLKKLTDLERMEIKKNVEKIKKINIDKKILSSLLEGDSIQLLERKDNANTVSIKDNEKKPIKEKL